MIKLLIIHWETVFEKKMQKWQKQRNTEQFKEIKLKCIITIEKPFFVLLICS